MNWQTLITAAAAWLLGTSLVAQDACPKQRAVTVPQRIDLGPSIDCAGITYTIPGITVTTATGCPLFVTVTPAHETTESSKEMTDVRITATVPTKVLYFVCRTRYLLFIPIGSSCEPNGEANVGAYHRMLTVGCSTAGA